MTLVDNTIDDLPKSCRETVAVLQRVLDADLSYTALDGDSHAPACPACRERIAAAKLMMATLATPADITLANPDLAASIVAAIQADRAERRRLRRRAYGFTAGLATAATLVLAVWLTAFGPSKQHGSRPDAELAATQPLPDRTAPPVRIGDEFAKAEHALLESSRPITDSAAAAPQVLARITDVLTQPNPPAPEFEPARQSLLHLPEVARSGFEPVTATTQKAFARLMKDVGMKGSW